MGIIILYIIRTKTCVHIIHGKITVIPFHRDKIKLFAKNKNNRFLLIRQKGFPKGCDTVI